MLAVLLPYSNLMKIMKMNKKDNSKIYSVLKLTICLGIKLFFRKISNLFIYIYTYIKGYR